jgi:hypothetical protein
MLIERLGQNCLGFFPFASLVRFALQPGVCHAHILDEYSYRCNGKKQARMQNFKDKDSGGNIRPG